MPRDPSIFARLGKFDRERLLGPTERALDFGFFYPPLNDPKVARAFDARFMRDDDHVVGLHLKGVARAYPLWIIDYYHVVNDTVAGEYVLIAHCDACMSGSAFLSSVDGQRMIFRGRGIANATLVVQDMNSRSVWVHYEGIAVDGSKAGAILDQVPTYHMTWGEWKGLHADTEVIMPDDPRQKDPRHGHGRAEWFGRATMSQGFRDTISGDLDLRLPENELCLFVRVGNAARAYPIAEVKKDDGVVHDTVSGRDIVVLSGPKTDGFAMAAFYRPQDSAALTFESEGQCFRDRETNSTWTIDGRCVEGKMKGMRLQPLDFYFLRWSPWVYFHPDTGIWASASGEVKGCVLGEFEPIVTSLMSKGFVVHVQGEVLNLLRPLRAERGMTLLVNGDRMRLYRFADDLSARDFEYLEGNCLRKGRFVMRSDPELFTDNSHLTRLPEDKINWSGLLSDGQFREAFCAALSDGDEEPGRVGFREIYEGLQAKGHRLEDVPVPIEGGGYAIERFITHGQLRVDSLAGVLVSIDGDPFIIYMFKDESSAKEYLNEEPHAFYVDRFVFRSTPNDMYTSLQVHHKPDGRVSWSRRLQDESFRKELREIIHGGLKPFGIAPQNLEVSQP